MSTEDTSATAIYATLIRGRVYYLRDKEFMNGEEHEVSAEDRDWLENSAFDEVTVEGEGEHQRREKFKFEVRPRGEKPDAAAPSPRSRNR